MVEIIIADSSDRVVRFAASELIKYLKAMTGASIYLDNAWASMVDDTVMALKIIGTKGGAGMWPFSIVKNENGKNVGVKPDLAGNKYQTQFEHFVECVINDADSISPAGQGLQLLKMLGAIYASSKTGKAVKIKDE
ncbi:MAG: Gfo/Idh/MocA family oxidoreductase [Kiritimatiellae bacterium]|nr:Gfo/Idh/MocA family oxidoreductase [Kiritimatiellia bacterium]